MVSPVRRVVEELHAHRYPAHANQEAHAELLGDAEGFFRAQHIDVFGYGRFRGSIETYRLVSMAATLVSPCAESR